MKQNYCEKPEIICSCEYGVKIGGVTNNHLWSYDQNIISFFWKNKSKQKFWHIKGT